MPIHPDRSPQSIDSSLTPGERARISPPPSTPSTAAHAGGQHELLQDSTNRPPRAIVHVHVHDSAVGAGLGSFFAISASSTGETHLPHRAELVDAVAHDAGESRQQLACASPAAGGWESNVRRLRAAPALSSFMCHAASSARMSIDSVFATAPRPRGCSCVHLQTLKRTGRAFRVADEDRERAERD